VDARLFLVDGIKRLQQVVEASGLWQGKGKPEVVV
jgi:hypothetical protein